MNWKEAEDYAYHHEPSEVGKKIITRFEDKRHYIARVMFLLGKHEARIRVCEWKATKVCGTRITVYETDCEKSWIRTHLNYCPYCGGRVKVVEG